MVAALVAAWSISIICTRAYESSLEIALHQDDECDLSGDCALQALQLTRLKVSPDSANASTQANKTLGSSLSRKWRKEDVTEVLQKKMDADLAEIQPVVVGIWRNITAIQDRVNASVTKVEKASGKKADFGDVDEEIEEKVAEQSRVAQEAKIDNAISFSEASRTGRRRRYSVELDEELPPRTREVMTRVKYLNKEMELVKIEINKVDRMCTWLAGVMTSMKNEPVISDDEGVSELEFPSLGGSRKAEPENPDGIPLGEPHEHMVTRNYHELLKDIHNIDHEFTALKERVVKTERAVDSWLLAK